MSAPTSEQLLSGVRSGRWLDEQVFPPLRFAVPNLIPEGLSLLVAPPKAGKSWFVLSASLAAACGGAVLGHVRLEPRPVLYLALEDGHRRLQDRCRQLLGATPIPQRFDYLTQLHPGAHAAEMLRAWLDIYGDEQPLVVLDTTDDDPVFDQGYVYDRIPTWVPADVPGSPQEPRRVPR